MQLNLSIYEIQDWSDDDDTLGRKTDIRAKTPESMQLQEVQDRTLQEGFEELMIRDASPVDDHRASLERNVVIKYWKGRVENDPSLQSLHESSNLRADWSVLSYVPCITEISWGC